ncbi:hypothetical protein H072_10430 [Dactylellina haptotyla CBS 200.50]|uniref:SMP-30/Gluconolactonase/LRE-like region domain-containing protein n=1 Tax=Dactylellina haptotyla (strain CBS 200.50) TaxID=1284197 RepID=S7ZZA3_DACHA|nr:hypothetical protein H072_10430 [Dactylellina haptotyla CBS 200.50]
MVQFSNTALAFATTILFARRSAQSCPPISGNIFIKQAGLFPENLDWDSCNCRLYLGSLFNATGVEYNPYTNKTRVITFPNVSFDPDFHIGGVDYDFRKKVVYFGADAGAPFNTNGQDLSGPNRLIRYDPQQKKILYNIDMAPFQNLVKLQNGGQLVSGFQDMAEDKDGDTYFIATFGNAIAKVTPRGTVSVYYAQNPVTPSIAGYSGIFSIGNKLVIADNSITSFVTFDTTQKPGRPTIVAPKCQPAGYTFSCDGFYAPPKYGGKVALCSNNALQGIAVYKSADNWKTAKYLGLVPNNDPAVGNGFPTATVQITDSIYISEEYFFGSTQIPDLFPLIDITSQVQSMVNQGASC